LKLIAYPTSGAALDIRPSPATRDWMDALPEGFGYRCLPLNIANMHGWEILCPRGFRARWDGGVGKDAIRIDPDEGDGALPSSHFGSGVLTFHVPALFRSPPGINLMVTGPLNRPKHGIGALSGIVETDWSPYTFTMNWRFTAPYLEVEWEAGEPYCFFFPLQRELIETVEPEFHSLDDEPELARSYRDWNEKRLQFNRDLQQPGSDATRQRWQKDYYRGQLPGGGGDGPPDHRIKLHVRPWRA
jgi:hypothetical protein